VDDLERDAAQIVRRLEDGGPVVVVDEGRPAGLLLRLTDDELEEHLLARNESLQAELDRAFAECLEGVGRPAADVLRELSEGDG